VRVPKRTAAAALLADLDRLPYGERMAVLAGRAHSGDLAAMPELAAGDRFARATALFLAVVAGDRDGLRRALADPDAGLRATALIELLRLGAAPPLGPLLRDAPAVTRDAAYRALRRVGPAEIADGLVEEVRAVFGDREAARLLPACSAATVTRLLPGLGYAVGSWRAVAQRHPGPVLADAARQLTALTTPDRDRWWPRYGAGVAAAAVHDPPAVLDLLERFAPATALPLPLTTYGRLTAAAPDRVLALLTDPARAPWLLRTPLPRAVLARLGRLAPERLFALAERLREADFLLAALLRAVPPRHRGAVYDAAVAGTDRARTRPADVLIDVLPHAHREAEAVRILALPLVRDDEQASLHYTAYLPWERAEPALTAATRRAQPEDRAAGYELLLACAGRTRDPAPVAQAVQRLARLRNEQDPVRARALTALSRLPADLLGPDSAGALGQVVTDAVTARDSSAQTVSALGRLAVTALRSDAGLRTWSLSTLDTLFGTGALPALGRWDTGLRRGQEQAVFAAVRSWLAAGVARARYEPLFAVATALGRRAWAVPELQAMLGRAVGTAAPDRVVRQAVSLWLADPTARSQRASAVLAALDQSALTLPEVWQTACFSRTDLLDPALTGRLSGRFVQKRVRWIPYQAPAVRRWLPRQQQAYLRLLTDVLTDPGATAVSRLSAVHSAATVPDGGAALVASIVDSPDIGLGEAALGALVHTDRPAEAVPALLARLDGDRARVAAYALGRAARFTPPGRLDVALAELALGRTPAKVTSRKEAVRLLVRLGAPTATTVLAQVVEQPGQHRDIRAAAISAARQRLDDGPMWTVLGGVGSREDQLAVLAAGPFELAERHRRAYAELIVSVGRGPDPVVARAAWQALPAWTSWTPDLAPDALARLTDLTGTHVWRAVLPAVVAQLDAGRELLPAILLGLATVDATDPTADDPARDRPARRRLDELVDRLTAWAERNPVRDLTALRTAGQRLAERAEFVPQAAALLLAAVRLTQPAGAGPTEPAGAATGLGAICDLLSDRPVTAARLADRLAGRTGDPAVRLAAAAELAARADVAGGLFACALLTAGRDQGWPGGWRALVGDLRGSPHPDVRATALALPRAEE
jgi:hypothetical protein